MKLAIIGGGAACVALLAHLADAGSADLEVDIFETSGRVGPGNAYRIDLDSALLNRPTSEMSLYPDDPAHFTRWLIESGEYSLAADAFVSRRLFGQYLEAEYFRILRRWPHGAVTLVPRNVEHVDDVGGRYAVRVENQLKARHADVVALCVGTADPSDFYGLEGSRGFVPSPYPLIQSLKSVSEQQDVLVIGTGLSAVDVAVALLDRGQRGTITLASRHGLLPAVRGTIMPSGGSLLDARDIPARRLALIDVARIVHGHIGTFADPRLTLREFVLSEDPTARLRRHLDQAITNRDTLWPLRTLSYASLTRFIQMMTDASLSLFVAQYHARFQSLRNPMPPATAALLLHALDENRLRVFRGLTSVDPGREVFTYSVEGGEHSADTVVNTARSYSHSGPQDDDALVKGIVRQGIGVSTQGGGLKIDLATNRVLPSSRAATDRCFALGEMTAHDLYYVSSLESISLRAAKVATSVLAHVSSKAERASHGA